MTEFKLVVTKDARTDLSKYLSYIKRKYKNQQALKSIRDDFYQTAASLRTLAETIQQPESERMKQKGLKRINFCAHSYFLLFRTKGNTVEIVQMFHFLEDYENKLR